MTSSREDDSTKHVIGYLAKSFDHSNTHTEYPYPASSPHPTHVADAKRTLYRLVLATLFFVIVSVIFILIVISFIVWFLLQPQLPKFRVASATIPPLNTSIFAIPPHWVVKFLVYNPNKKITISYNQTKVVLYYGKKNICDVVIEAFEQNKKTEMDVWAKFDEFKEQALNLVACDRKNDVVSLNIEILSYMSFKLGHWSRDLRLTKVICKDVRVSFNASTGVGSYLGGSEYCKVDAAD